jgi:hypothetical protein
MKAMKVMKAKNCGIFEAIPRPCRVVLAAMKAMNVEGLFHQDSFLCLSHFSCTFGAHCSLLVA